MIHWTDFDTNVSVLKKIYVLPGTLISSFLVWQHLQPWDPTFFTEAVKSSGFQRRDASSSDVTPDDVILSERAKRDLQDSIPIYEELIKYKIQPQNSS